MTNQTASVASVFRAVAMAAAILVVFALTASPASAKEPAAPQQVALASGPFAALEKAFWACDYAGTNGSVDADTGIACIELTRELKMKKFNGDFEAMVAWWQQHKPAQHLALAAARR